MHTFPPSLLIGTFALYIVVLSTLSWFTSKGGDNRSYFSSDRKSSWFTIAFGMVGTSMTAVTFISVPGNVLNQNFYYLPLVFGFMLGYIVVAKVLIPLYYKMNLTSIYTYLEERFGIYSYRSGAGLFLISRILGTSVRLFVAILVIETFLPNNFAPFWLVASIYIGSIFLYTYRGGVKTIIRTDLIQTILMVSALFLTLYFITKEMGWNGKEMVGAIFNSGYSKVFDWEWGSATNSIKQLFSGIFITIAMTGLDQEMMQKSLTCKSIGEAQKNVYTTASIILVVNFLFLSLGALLILYTNSKLGGMEGIGLTNQFGQFSKGATDKIFPTIAGTYMGLGVALIFIVGLISASFPSAAGALTALTTSFSIDFLRINRGGGGSDRGKIAIRKGVQATFAAILLLLILTLRRVNSDTVIDLIYTLVSYSYGPLLGLFFFGLITRWRVKDRWVPFVALLSPILCYILNSLMESYLNFGLGFTIIIVNALLTFVALYLLRENKIYDNAN
ncbi:MAG: sodium:solute symporter [Bacteroidales bacterium]